MEHLLEPEGTVAEKFMLMIHERIIGLEEQNFALRSELDETKQSVARLMEEDLKTYDASQNRFSDGSWIDWCVWEPIDFMLLCHANRPTRFLPPSYSTAMVKHLQGSEAEATATEMELPVERNNEKYHKIMMPVQLNVSEFFTKLHGFYQQAITHGDMSMHDGNFGEINLLDLRSALGVLQENKKLNTNHIRCLRDTYFTGTCCTTPGYRCSSKFCGTIYMKGTAKVNFDRVMLFTAGQRLVVRFI